MGSIAKNSFYSSITFGLRFAANALLFIIIARVLGAEEFGRFAFAMSFTGLFMVVVDYGFNLQIIRDVAVAPEKAVPLANRVISGKIILSLVTTVILLVTIKSFGYPSETEIIIFVLWAAALLYSFGLFLNTIFRGLNQFQYETYPTILLNVVQFSLAIIMLLLGYKSIAVAAVYLFSRIIYFAVSLGYVDRKIGRLSFIPDFSSGWQVLKQSMPFGIHAILAAIYFQIDTVFLSHYCGNTEVGHYQAAMRIVLATMIIYDIINSSYYPLIARKFQADAAGFKEDGLALNKYMLLVGGSIAVFLMINAEYVIRLIYGSGYERSVVLLQLLSCVIFLRFAGASYASFITIAENQGLRAVGVAVSVVVNISLNIYLIPIYGAVGAAITSIITHLVLDMLYFFFSIRMTRNYFFDSYCSKGIAILMVGIFSGFALKEMPQLSLGVFIVLLVAMLKFSLNDIEKQKLRKLITRS